MVAARYLLAVAGNHPLVDGNKRVGYVAGITFLVVNGHLDAELLPDDAECGRWLEDAVAGLLPVTEFVDRLRTRLP